jgi:hypothetical protein
MHEEGRMSTFVEGMGVTYFSSSQHKVYSFQILSPASKFRLVHQWVKKVCVLREIPYNRFAKSDAFFISSFNDLWGCSYQLICLLVNIRQDGFRILRLSNRSDNIFNLGDVIT